MLSTNCWVSITCCLHMACKTRTEGLYAVRAARKGKDVLGEAQPAAKAEQTKLSLSAENRVKKKKKEMWFWYLLLHPC